MEIKLYHSHSIIPHYDKTDNVRFDWFVLKRNKELELPFEKLIEGYEHLDDLSRCWAINAIDEFLTHDEVEALREYLMRVHNTELIVGEVEFPFPGKVIGYREIPVGGDCDNYMLSKEDEYDLPFEVYAYYDRSYHRMFLLDLAKWTLGTIEIPVDEYCSDGELP